MTYNQSTFLGCFLNENRCFLLFILTNKKTHAQKRVLQC